MRALLTTIADVALGALPWAPGEDRYSLTAIALDDLEAAIAQNAPGARLLATEVHPVSQGTTDRVRIQLTWNEVPSTESLPRTVFVKGTPKAAASRILLSTFGLAEYETRFYNEIQPAVSDLTMRAYLARGRRGGRYLTALEDLGGAGQIVFHTAGEDPPLEHTREMMATLGTLHGRFWRSPRFSTDLSWVGVFRERPGQPFAHPAVKMLTKKLFKQDRDMPPSTRRATEFFVENRPLLDRAWEALPVTLVHGDCHLGNTYTTADGLAGIYDWQNIHKMNGLRDVAYYLVQSLPTEERRRHERDLLELYLDSLSEAGAGKDVPSYAVAYDTYRMLAFDGWLAAYSTLVIGGLQDESAVEIGFERCAQALDDLDTESALRSAAARS